MTVIHLTSCHRCKPEKWKLGKEAVGSYWCTVCKKHIKRVLERR